MLEPVYFSGEEVPLYESSVNQRWLRVLQQQSADREYLFALRKKADRFFPIIEPMLKRYKIPSDFKYLPLVESSLVNHSVSVKGAAGYWQLMPETARLLGLQVDGTVDERYDLNKATVAACRHLRQLYKQLGSWTLVAAAYNSGSGHVISRMEQQGGQRSYYALRLHQETRMYLYRVLAYKELLTRPRLYRELLQPDVMAYLNFPIPRQQPRLKATNPPPADTGARTEPDPTWGPRMRNLLEELTAHGGEEPLPSELPADPVPMVTAPVQAQTVALGLMGLRVLRFRRSKMYEVYLAAKRRIQPLFGWDWV